MIEVYLHPKMTLEQCANWCAKHQMILTINYKVVKGQLEAVTTATSELEDYLGAVHAH